MKDSMDATAARQAQEPASEEFVSRKADPPVAEHTATANGACV